MNIPEAGYAAKRPIPLQYLVWTGSNQDECIEFTRKDLTNPADADETGVRFLPLFGVDNGRDAQVYDFMQKAWIPAVVGDVIIKGTRGECYPHDRAGFEKNYRVKPAATEANKFAKLLEVPDYDFVVDAMELYKVISDHYQVPFNAQQHEPMDGPRTYRITDVISESDPEWDEHAAAELAEWKAAKPPAGGEYRSYPDLWHMRENTIGLEILLWDLNRQGLLPCGKYLLLTDW